MRKVKTTFLVLSIALLALSCGQEKQTDDLKEITDNNNEKIKATTPDEAIEELKNGNIRFMEGKLTNTNFAEQIQATKEKQTPHSVVLSCLDSRVPAEIIFDQGIGNIFVARNAGNIEDENIIGSMEFAVKFAGSKLIVVMGHSHCGAVKGAIDNVEAGHLTQLVNQIKPAIPEDKEQANLVEKTVKNNVDKTVSDILEKSEIINDLVESGQIKIVKAFYNIETGEVEFLE